MQAGEIVVEGGYPRTRLLMQYVALSFVCNTLGPGQSVMKHGLVEIDATYVYKY
jgi:hypothetical protein